MPGAEDARPVKARAVQVVEAQPGPVLGPGSMRRVEREPPEVDAALPEVAVAEHVADDGVHLAADQPADGLVDEIVGRQRRRRVEQEAAVVVVEQARRPGPAKSSPRASTGAGQPAREVAPRDRGSGPPSLTRDEHILPPPGSGALS